VAALVGVGEGADGLGPPVIGTKLQGHTIERESGIGRGDKERK